MPSFTTLALALAAATAAEDPRDAALATLAVAAAPEGDVPAYVPVPGDSAPAWLRLGGELRMRVEDRSGRLPRADASDLTLGVTRARAFAALAPAAFPVGAAIEVMDARQLATDFPETPLTVNELDVLQLRVRLTLTRVLGAPLELDAGRLSLDADDRRLVARNRFRNTVNAFEGLRLRLGGPAVQAGVEVLALRPVRLETRSPDERDGSRKLFGALARIERRRLVLAPYYLFHESSGDRRDAELHTVGVHLFGRLDERWDHDAHVSLQLGRADRSPHRAVALHGEIGRRLSGAWAPRVAGFVNYASGDADPYDGRSGRYDPLFGASHAMYGFTDLFGWQNLVNPTLALTLQPRRGMRVSVLHRAYWLASARDAFVRAGLFDPSGRSGTFIGQELDVELEWRLAPWMALNAQYGELFAGGFVDRTGGGTGARVFYVAVTAGS